MDGIIKIDDSTLNSGRIIGLFLAAPVLRTFVQYLAAFCSPPETASDVISAWFVRLTVPHQLLQYRDHR